MNKDLLNEYSDMTDVRLNRYLSDAGVCSRREADRLIQQGKVIVDGKVAVTGMKVHDGMNIVCDGKTVKRTDELILLAVNKPRGIVCTTDSRREKDNIVDFISYPSRIYPVGRLDKDSEGLILMTNDGSLVNHILKARTYHEKEYIVTVNKKLKSEFLTALSNGVQLEEALTRPCKVRKLDDHTFDIILTQGLNRQIRRMCRCFGYRVVALKRIRIMNIELGDLKTGKYRHVSGKELRELKKLIADDLKGNIDG